MGGKNRGEKRTSLAPFEMYSENKECSEVPYISK